jgi:beta-glucosidase
MAYRDSSAPVEDRVNDLISRMTLEEKVAQTLCIWEVYNEELLDGNGDFDRDKADEYFADKHGIGEISMHYDEGGGKPPREMAELTNEIQEYVIEKSRLDIPVIFHVECLHGHAAIGATSFPVPIAMASTFNTALVEEIYTKTAEEARVRGGHHALTPVVDVARDPRWGRVEETFGEDPYLVAEMGIAAVNGLQGDALFKDKKRVAATLKHFAAYGEPEDGSNAAPVNISERTLREVHLYPFKEAIQKAGALSVMPAYHEIDGVPCHASKWLIRDVLRGEWGFDGFVVTDYNALRQLHARDDLGHHVASSFKDAARIGINAGVDLELPDPFAYPHLVDLIKEGEVEESILNEAVKNILRIKFKLGLFDDPYVDPEIVEAVVGSKENKKLALEAALESITLLKNKGGLAPLNREDAKIIAVIGPNGDRRMLGGYAGVPDHNVSLYEGIKAEAGDGIQVLFSEGCKITIGGNWADDEVTPFNPEEDRKSIVKAVKTAEKADVVVLAIGGNEQTSREAWATDHLGDRPSLKMVGLQEELIEAVVATGKPIIAVVFGGKPLNLTQLSEIVPTIFQVWYLGQESGTAIAHVLFGKYNPAGKLPISFPRSVGHIPSYYNHKPVARRGYLFGDASPLYPFGYGLSYTTFDVGNLRLEKSEIGISEGTSVSVDVKNTGNTAGHEVVQLYIRDKVSSVTRPVKELKDFKKVYLKPGETRTVSLMITPEKLSFYNIDMDYVVEPGDFEITVGTSSVDNGNKTTLSVKKE